MSQSIEFYEARASEAANEARNAALDNVRERALRSEAAWRAMAERQVSIERQRDTLIQERALRDAE